MSDPDLFHRERNRSLQARIFDVFRNPPPTSAPNCSAEHAGTTQAHGASTTGYPPGERTRLLESYHRREPLCGLRGFCDHGTFSPRLEQGEGQAWDTGSMNGIGNSGRPGHPEETGPTGNSDSVQGPENIPSMESSTSSLPTKNWTSLYVYVRMEPSHQSFTDNHQVGPEAAGSLLTGTIVKASVSQGLSREDDEAASAMVVGVATAMAGSMILVAGLTRLGFLDNVLSRPFLRGFITAIGCVIFVDQLIPEVGLSDLAKGTGVSHGSTVDKLVFLMSNISEFHGLTTAMSFGSFIIIMVFRTLKKWLHPRYPLVVYFPDRIMVVIISAILTWHLGWDKQGLEILGPTKNTANGVFAFSWPFQVRHMKHVRTAMSTSFIIALLGFFESSVAAKGLGSARQAGVQGMSVSANREMVALGAANVVGGCFMALPAFGGYGRSKVNVSTGARSPMSSILLSIITFICIMVLLPYLYYLPKAVLSAMISVVAFSLIEECPHDLAFFIRLRGWTELVLMGLIFVSTIFYSLELGIALGFGLSILILIRHSTQPRIQILGKVSGTSDRFENAELHPEKVELVESALIVKIPEPLTFANTGDLKNRLRRLELYGTNRAHPSLPRIRPAEHNKNMIFDVHGVTSIDGSGTQVLFEIVDSYADEGARVFFCRLPNRDVFHMFERSGIVDRCGGMTHFVSRVDEALRLAESEQTLTA
ncbi:hypothetical protein EYZ11_000311 [Aspergillus tanneri]|uniref:STAS domain-containing protein n=1 Tax=Aspergillus tanneri TaxID=1220188 RepID=A0A4V3UQT7_9EURO|nr:hypothetical protein EYZ11_000311 [Aspergillus tanneri]